MVAKVKSNDVTEEQIAVNQWVILKSNELAKIETISKYNGFTYVQFFIPTRGKTEWMYFNHIASIVDQTFNQQAQIGERIQIATTRGKVYSAIMTNDFGATIELKLLSGVTITAARSLIVNRTANVELERVAS